MSASDSPAVQRRSGSDLLNEQLRRAEAKGEAREKEKWEQVVASAEKLSSDATERVTALSSELEMLRGQLSAAEAVRASAPPAAQPAPISDATVDSAVLKQAKTQAHEAESRLKTLEQALTDKLRAEQRRVARVSRKLEETKVALNESLKRESDLKKEKAKLACAPPRESAEVTLAYSQLKACQKERGVLEKRLHAALDGNRITSMQSELDELRRVQKELKDENKMLALIGRRTEKQLTNVQKSLEDEQQLNKNPDTMNLVEGLRAENKKLREKVLSLDRAQAVHGKEMDTMHGRVNRLKAKLKQLTIERQAAGVGSQGTQAAGPCRLVKEEVYESMQEAVKKVGILEHACESQKKVLQAKVRDRHRRLKEANLTTEALKTEVEELERETRRLQKENERLHRELKTGKGVRGELSIESDGGEGIKESGSLFSLLPSAEVAEGTPARTKDEHERKRTKHSTKGGALLPRAQARLAAS